MEIIGKIGDISLIQALDNIHVAEIKKEQSKKGLGNIFYQEVDLETIRYFSEKFGADFDLLKRQYAKNCSWLFSHMRLFNSMSNEIEQALNQAAPSWRAHVSKHNHKLQFGATSSDIIGWHNDHHVLHNRGMKATFICTGNPENRVLLSGKRKTSSIVPQPGDVISFNLQTHHALGPTIGENTARKALMLARFVDVYGMSRRYFKQTTPQKLRN